MPKCVLLCLFAALFLLSVPTAALQITFPLDLSGGDTLARPITLRPRSLKERFDRFEEAYSGDFYRFGTYGDRSRAFRPDRTFYTNNLSFLAASKMKNGLDYEAKISLRTATDRTLSFRNDLHITSYYGTLGRKDVWKIRTGDLFPNLSRYSLNRFMQGAQGDYARLLTPDIKIRTAGVIGRTERSRESITLRRVVLAAAETFESAHLDRGKPKWSLGYRYASASDVLGSVDNARALPNLQIDVHSTTYNYQLPLGWSFSGENAWSRGGIDRRTTRDRGGYAWLNDISWLKQSPKPYIGIRRLLPFAFQANWELVDPYFRSPLGVAAANQKRWSARTAHRFSDDLDWTMSFFRLEDNVRNQSPGNLTSTTRTSNVAVNMRPFHLFGASPNWTDHLDTDFRNIRAKFEFRYNNRDATNASVNQKIEDYIYQLLYSKWGTNLTGDYQFQITDDDAVPTADKRLQAYGIRATHPWTWKKWNVRFFPNAGYRISRDHFRLPPATSTYLQTTTLGLGITWEELSGNFSYLILDNNRAPQGNDFVQQRFNGSITYTPYLFPTFRGVLSYGYTDQNDEVASRSYRQTETRLTLGYTF